MRLLKARQVEHAAADCAQLQQGCLPGDGLQALRYKALASVCLPARKRLHTLKELSLVQAGAVGSCGNPGTGTHRCNRLGVQVEKRLLDACLDGSQMAPY